MVSIEETNRNKLGNPRRPDPGKGTDEMPQKIIDFESGRKMLEKAWLEKEQIRARLVKRSRLPGSLRLQADAVVLCVGQNEVRSVRRSLFAQLILS